MNIYFLSNIGPRLACMRTSWKTSARLKITFVDMTYPKGWTGSLLLCPLIFSCFVPILSKLFIKSALSLPFTTRLPSGLVKGPILPLQAGFVASFNGFQYAAVDLGWGYFLCEILLPGMSQRKCNLVSHLLISCVSFPIFSTDGLSKKFVPQVHRPSDIVLGCRDGAMVRALISHQCGSGSIPRLCVICGLSLLVLYSAPRGFLRVLRFPFSLKTNIWLDLC